MNTKLFVPQNYFVKLFLAELKPADDIEIHFSPASLISKKVLENDNSIGLIPSLDLLTFKDFFLSSRIGISFNALLSNAYLYFNEEQETLEELSLAGDLTSNEILLSKILFKEFYDIDIKPVIKTNEKELVNTNFIQVGDRNYVDEIFLKGLSFSEEIIEMINAPYINFVLAGLSDDSLKGFVNRYENNFIDGHDESAVKVDTGFPDLSNDFININLQHIIFDFENQDIEGIKNLLQMPYYHGITKELIELKFV